MSGNEFIDTLLDTADAPASAPAGGLELAFTIKKFALYLLLDKADSVVPTKDIMPVLKNFQVEATPGRLRVVATDLELSVVASTEVVDVTTPGTVVFPAKKLMGIVKESGDGDVQVTVSNGTAAVTIGNTTWHLKLQGGADYPPMPEVGDVPTIPVDRSKFLAALQCVRYAACKEPTRASLMLIDIKDGKMTTCDGARFQQARTELPLNCQIPIGAVDDLMKLLRSTDLPTIGVGDAGNHLIFAFGGDVFIVNKLMANVPNMEQLLLRPALENKHELTVDRGDLLGAVKRVRINADPETSAIGLSLATGTLTVSARDKYGNTASETIEAGWKGNSRTLVVNHVFLTDMINGYDGRSCSFWLGDDTRTRKSPLMLKNTSAGTVGVVQQMLGDWVGA